MDNRCSPCRSTKVNLDNKRFAIVVSALLILLPVTIAFSLSAGRYEISVREILQVFVAPSSENIVAQKVIFNLRLPRILAAMLIGASLAIAGSTYQGLYRNPLVSPDVLGVSTGASVGAAIGIMLRVGHGMLILLSFVAGIFSMCMTLLLSRFVKQKSHVSMVLAGIIVSSLGSSVLGIIKYVADSETVLAEITFWEMGSLAKITYEDLKIIAPFVLILTTILILSSWKINLFSLGDEEAKTLGANVTYSKYFVIFCATLLTATAVSFSGIIGWIGLTMPQMARILVGDNHVRSMPVSVLLAMPFLIVVDALARTISPGEVPLAILTGIVGAPIFASVLIRKQG